MNITVEKKPECMATVKVKVPADKVASERQTIVSGYTKEAKIPGFRPGKAPTKVIEKRFEKQIKDEPYSRLINAGCDDAIKQESLKVISVNVTGEPSFSDAGELSFSADIILAPEFEVPEYLGIEIEAPSDEVTDAELDSSLTDLQQRFAEFNDVERGLSDGDFAVVDFTATTDGKPVAEVIGKPAGFLDGREDHWTKIEDDSFMPGFGSGLKGLKAGDKKELKLTMNDEFPLSDVRGVEIVFDVTVKEVKEQVLPELDDDFAAKLLPEKGIEELKNVIREQLSVEKKKSVADAKENQVVEILNGRVDFDIPLALLEQEAQGNAVNMIERARQQGMTEEMIIEQQNEISESANKQARLNLKTNFILQEIAIKENIEVSDQEVIQRISGMAQQENKPVKKYIKELQKADAIQNVRNSVLIGKTNPLSPSRMMLSTTSLKKQIPSSNNNSIIMPIPIQKKNTPLKQLLISSSLVLAAVLTTPLAAEEYTPPPLQKDVPTNLELPADFAATKRMAQKRSKFWSLWFHELAPQQGVHPLVVTGIHSSVCSSEVLSKGDVIFAINGAPLRKKPIDLFNTAYTKASKELGYLWLTRWRQGKVSSVMLDLATRPLDLTLRPKPGRGHDWRLGPMGASGWLFCKSSMNGASKDARQIILTRVDKGGPCDGKLKVDDVILGAFEKEFSYDVRKALAAAIDQAETEKGKGALKLMVWRKDDTSKASQGKKIEVTVTLPVMGTYSKTMPFNCPKSDKLIDQTCDYLLTRPLSNTDKVMGGHWQFFVGYWNGLGLLATGRKDVIPKVREFAHGICIPDPSIPVKNPENYNQGKIQSLEKHQPMVVWGWAYRTIFLSEYYLVTKDEKVLPTIREYATKLAMGQSGAGSWGQTFAARENAGYLHGHLGGYGAINQNTLNAVLALILAKKCGIENDEITKAIARTNDFLKFYIGKGAIPYGDHTPGYEDFTFNGKSAGAAVFFDLAENEKGARFFSAMSMGHAVTGREAGHGGHFFSHLWGGIGAARGGERMLHNFYDQMNGLFTLERQPDGRMVNQRPAGGGKDIGDLKTHRDFTGIRLMQLCAPRKAIYLTGKGTPDRDWLTQKRMDEIFAAGLLRYDKEARSKLSKDKILALLQDELPAIRTIAVNAISEQELKMVPELLKLLDSKSIFTRAGAAQALINNGYASKEAVAKLIHMVGNDTDLLCRIHAVNAFCSVDKRRGLLAVAKPAIPALLRLATKRWKDDPNQKLQVEIGVALFNTGSPMRGKRGLCVEYGLDETTRPLLLPALKVLLKNPNGSARGWVSSWTYKQLTDAEIEQLWGDIYMATRYRGPSCVMWGQYVQQRGMALMAKHHIAEGLEFAAHNVTTYKLSDSARNIIPLYGGYAKKYIPILDQQAAPLRGHKYAPNRKTAEAIDKLIETLKAMPDKPDFKLISIADHLKGLSNPNIPQIK